MADDEFDHVQDQLLVSQQKARHLTVINSELIGFVEIFTRLTPEEGLSPNALAGLIDLAKQRLANATDKGAG